ncbi:MAG TPA: twin-arginine translocase TatA/TatE family subunit [Bacteroidia bacterium]|jgi:sec-independent protein translocase protein TatA|nr:twin-arginine translocase TatA/TatE family subunit [Bacteroidia bacterium]
MILSTLLFLDFSGGEFLLIGVVFLMFFGSKSIPGMARTLGKAVRDFKEAAGNVQREITDNITIEEVKQVVPPTPPTTIPQQTTPQVPPQSDGNTTSENVGENK